MKYIPLLVSIASIFQTLCTASRVSVFRCSEDEDFHATMHNHPHQQIMSWSTETTFNIRYSDDTEITVSSDISPGFFDIFVNDRYTHTCTFRNDEHVYAVLFDIFKKGSKTRLAPSSSSICARSFYDDTSFNHMSSRAEIDIQQTKRQKFKRIQPLRIELLKHKSGW